MRTEKQPQERLLVTGSPLLRSAALGAIATALLGQGLFDDKGRWYEVISTRCDTLTHKVYGTLIEADIPLAYLTDHVIQQ
jgi:hypothetical protein